MDTFEARAELKQLTPAHIPGADTADPRHFNPPACRPPLWACRARPGILLSGVLFPYSPIAGF